MGITHHSNYIRWMEEARVDFLKNIGWDYSKLEEMGIMSPVIAVNCKYKLSTTFEEMIKIEINVAEYNGAKLTLKYIMTNPEGKTVCEAVSEHCFVNSSGKLIRMKKEYPDFHNLLTSLAEGNQ
ncbi:MAG: acyl-CoA thioesterase [Firmicutes bacterium]|nr:acyl-CoA thioesterase [Bacillota bacterium]